MLMIASSWWQQWTRPLSSQNILQTPATKWISNNCEVMATIPEHHKAKQVKELDLDKEKMKEETPIERAHGIQWNTDWTLLPLKCL